MMTLSEVINYINKALNYPSVSIVDIDLYFNQAFSEINTQLHISIPTLEEMRLNAIEAVTKYDNLIKGVTEPLSSQYFPIAYMSDIEHILHPNEHPQIIDDAMIVGEPSLYPDLPIEPPHEVVESDFYYVPDAEDGKLFFYKGNFFEKIYYMFFDNLRKKYRLYESRFVENGENAVWSEIYENPSDINLEDYLPKDWIFLFLIPYVCFKQSVRDGDQGILFNNEMATGFNQLRDCYSIPERVPLLKVAHLPAYTYLIRHNPDIDFRTLIPTRAIYDVYKIPKAVGSIRTDFYDKGGWGV